MHGSVHDFVVSQTVANWRNLPTGHGQGALIPTIIPLDQEPFEQKQFKRILDIGSLNINGSMKKYDFLGTQKSWREMIGNEEYVGIDLVPGPDVDLVMDAHDLSEFPADIFDLIVCLSVLEHDSNIKKTLLEGYRVLKPGGLFLITTVDESHPEHMEEHGVELPYNHITEDFLRDMLYKLFPPNKAKLWHIGCDLFIRIEK